MDDSQFTVNVRVRLIHANLIARLLYLQGNIVTGTDLQTQSVIDCGGLTKLTPLLKVRKLTMTN